MAGKVYLVGAGPGDPGLVTVKGLELIQKADCIVYDRLSAPELLSYAKEDCEFIYVGKADRHHTLLQEEINELLVTKAKEHACVVRLKGGDVYVFGRGGEELELLTANGIPYEVVPGVTSSIAVPAYNGIPVTHRDFCSSVHIITGHRRAGREYDIDFQALVNTRGTLVFLMGIAALNDICQGLLDAGMDPKMPAAVLQKGTTSDQKRVVATVATLKEEVERQGIETPAIIVVGRVCQLSEEFGWYERLPLAGWKVLVTRPKGRSSRTADELRRKGAEVLELPSIRTVPLEDQSRLHQALEKIEQYQWLVFTSPTGAEVFFEEMFAEKKDIRCLSSLKVAAIGQGTAKTLEQRGILADLIPEVYDGDSLGEALAQGLDGGENILIPRASKGNANLVKILMERGAQVDDIPTYDTVYEKNPLIDVAAEIKVGGIDCVVFTSASTVKGFVESTGLSDYSHVTAACIGKQTKAAADSYGMKTYMAAKATIDDLTTLVEKIKTNVTDSSTD